MNRSFAQERLVEHIVKLARADFQKADVAGTSSADMKDELSTNIGKLVALAMEDGPAAFDRMFPQMLQGNFHDPAHILSGALTAEELAEGKAAPVSRVTRISGAIPAHKVVGTSAAPKESLRVERGTENFTREWMAALARARDTVAARLLKAEAVTTIPATEPLANLRQAFLAVNQSGFNAPSILLNPALAVFLASYPLTGTVSIFPNAKVNGGDVWGGPLLVSPGIPANDIFIVEPSGLIAARGETFVEIGESAQIEMSDAPAQEVNTPTAPTGKIVSAFQVDMVVFKAISTLGLKILRTSSVAVIEGCSAWITAAESSGS